MSIYSKTIGFFRRNRPVDTVARASARPVKVLFSYLTPEGAQLSMPIALLSALLKRDFPEVASELVVINRMHAADKCSVEWYQGEIERLRPDLLAISCMSPHWKHLGPYLEAAKRASPETKVLVGGYQAILSPDETIRHPGVDMICTGDGEQAFSDVVARLLSRGGNGALPIRGIWEKQPDGRVIKQDRVLTADLNTFPFPDYELFTAEGNLRELGISLAGVSKKFILPVMSGRGCPYKCTYCSNTSMLEMYKGEGSYIRKYDIERLVHEMAGLRDRYGVEYFEFWDELFMVNSKYTHAFLARYKEVVGLPFAMNARVERMDEQFCRFARDAGCHTIWFGIESGSETYRSRWLGRKMSNSDVLTAATNARNAGIQRLTFNIVGMPFESIEDAEQTLRLNQAIAPEFFYFFTYMPLEGTTLYDVAHEHDLLLPGGMITTQYLEGLSTGNFRMNLKQHEGGMSADEFSDICRRMVEFMQGNNRTDD